jgi:hypothetical protein
MHLCIEPTDETQLKLSSDFESSSEPALPRLDFRRGYEGIRLPPRGMTTI